MATDKCLQEPVFFIACLGFQNYSGMYKSCLHLILA